MRKCKRCREWMCPREKGRPPAFCSAACKQAAWRQAHRKSAHAVRVQTSSVKMDYETPPEFFAALDDDIGPFTLDAASSHRNALCTRHYTAEEDGLAQPWTGRVWLNPPYGRGIDRWMEKARDSARTTAKLVAVLVPARTSSRWWHEFVMPILKQTEPGEVRFLDRRLSFGDCKTQAPFSSVLVVFRNAASVTKLPQKTTHRKPSAERPRARVSA